MKNIVQNYESEHEALSYSLYCTYSYYSQPKTIYWERSQKTYR